MRTLKFKYYFRSKEHPELIQFSYFTLEQLIEHNPDHNKHWELIDRVQFTGLKDKNGKEIYEGDIVKCHDHPTGQGDVTNEVYFKDGMYQIKWSMIPLGDFGTAWTEIIGNIYENPELLK